MDAIGGMELDDKFDDILFEYRTDRMDPPPFMLKNDKAILESVPRCMV